MIPWKRYCTILKAYLSEEALKAFPEAKTDGGFGADYSKIEAGVLAACDEDLMVELEFFSNFPGCFKMFGPIARSYVQDPMIYGCTVNGVKSKYMYRQHAFNIMMLTLINDCIGKSIDEEYKAVIADVCTMYLKTKEAKLDGCCQLTLYNREDFKSIETRFERLKGRPTTLSKKTAKYDTLEQAVMNKFSKICNEVDATEVELLLHDLKGKKKLSKELIDICHYTEICLELMDLFITEYPRYFHRDKKGNPHIRLFKNGDAQFCLKYEVYMFMKRRNVNGPLKVELNKNKDPMATIDYQYVVNEWKKCTKFKFEDVPFIKTPIERSGQRAIFIPCPSGLQIILAADAFIELLRWLISQVFIFCKGCASESWDILSDVFFTELKNFDKKFEMFDETTPLFVNVEKYKEAQKAIRQKLKERLGNLMDAKLLDVPDGKKDFGVDILKHQLYHRGVLQWFPNAITNYHSKVLDDIEPMEENEEVLFEMQNVYRALENCQLLSIFEKLPEDNIKWIKNQAAASLRFIDINIERYKFVGIQLPD